MGRSLTPAPVGIGGGVFKLKAGTAVAQGDLLELGPDGKAYPVKMTDYAAVGNVVYGTAQTDAATGQIVAQTRVVAGQTVAYYRQALLQGPDGSIYTFTNNSGTTGLLLSKYSAGGGVVSRVAIDSAATSYANHQAFFLSNGSIAVLALATGTTTAYFAIYDTNLVQVKALTALSDVLNGQYFNACALSGGGFAVVYQPQAAPLTSRLVTYDNTGTAVLAPTTIWTRTGTTGQQYHRMAQLSNGNLVVAVSSNNTVSSIGLYHGIVTTGGASVLAFTNLDTTTNAGIPFPELSVMPGYYAVSRPNAVNQLAFVFDNAGTLQGSRFSAATTTGYGGVGPTTKIVNDGTAFYLIWARSSDSKEVLTKLPVTGTEYATFDVTTVANLYNGYMDAFCENGYIVMVGMPITGGNYAPLFWVFSLKSMAVVSASGTDFGTGPGSTSGAYPRIIPGGDFSFICLYDYGSVPSTNLCVGKYANTAIMGVAQATAAAGELVTTAFIAGPYATNPIEGSYSKTFDHSATNIVGNKGTILNNGVVLKGF